MNLSKVNYYEQWFLITLSLYIDRIEALEKTSWDPLYPNIKNF
jgi:hypothetical protein